MEIHGYPAEDSNRDTLVKLRECSMVLTSEEIGALIAFLSQVKKEFDSTLPIPRQAHRHLQDWAAGRMAAYPDLVIVYGGS